MSTTRRRVAWLVAALAAVSTVSSRASAQVPAASAAPAAVRAVGMPLPDGGLPPGVLTVRVVRGGFTDNLVDVEVRLDVGGKPRTARTGSDGRAQFAHLPIGAQVRASVVVGGRTFESESFAVPGQSGVRLLLAAGDSSAGLVAHGPAPGAPLPVVPVPAPAHAPAAAATGTATDLKKLIAPCAAAALAILLLLLRARA